MSKKTVKWNTRIRSASGNEANVLENAYRENGPKIPTRWNSGSKTVYKIPYGPDPHILGNFSNYPEKSGWQTSYEKAATIRTLNVDNENAYAPPGHYPRTSRKNIAKRASENPEKFNRVLYAKSVIPPKEVLMARYKALTIPLPPSPSPSPKKFNAFKLSPLAKLAKIAVSESPKGVRYLPLPKKNRRKTRRSKP